MARFAVHRYRFPGVEIKARLFRQYPFGEVGSHVIGYIGRINRPRSDRDRGRLADDDRPTTRAPTTSARSASSSTTRRELHGTTGFEEVEVDAGGRAVRTLSRTPGHAGQRPRAVARHQAAGDGRGAVRRPARRAGGDRPAQRRRARVRAASRASTPICSSTASTAKLGGAQRIARQAAAQSRRCAAPIRRARPSSRSWRWRRSSLGKRTPQQTIFDPGYFNFGDHRFRDDKPGGHGTVDMYKSIVAVVRHLLLHARQRLGVDDDPRLHGAVRLRPDDRHRHRGRAARHAALDRVEAQRLPQARKQQKWYVGETISVGIGQGYNAFTPLQLAQAEAMLADDGIAHQAAPGAARSRTRRRACRSRSRRRAAAVAAEARARRRSSRTRCSA